MNEKQTLSGQTGTNATVGTGLTTSQASSPVVEAGKTLAQDAKHVATEVVGQAKQQVSSKIEDQKEKAAQGLHSVAGAIRQTTDGLRDRDQLGVAPYVDGLADQVERFSDYILSSNVGQLVGEVEGFARREPAIFLGGAFLLGLVGARFLKSSGPAYESNRALGDNAYDYIRDEPRSAYGAGSYGRDDGERLSYGGRYGQRDMGRRETGRDDDDRGYRGQSGVERTRVASTGTSSNGTYGTSANGSYDKGSSSNGTYGTSSPSTSSYDKGVGSASSSYDKGTSTGGTYGTGTSTAGTYDKGTSTTGTYGTGTSTGGTYGTGTSTTPGAVSTGGTYGSGSGAVSNAGTGTSTATSTAGVGTSASPGGTYGAGSTTGATPTSTTGTGLDADLKSGTTLPGTGKTTPEAAGTPAVKPSESTGKR